MPKPPKDEIRNSSSENGEPTEEQIREEAYLLWEKDGSNPNADPTDYWDKAKRKLTKA